METPTRVKDEKILLSSPEYDWETVEDPKINEAPEIVRNNDTVNLVYSASGSWTDSYCLGVLTMNAADDPTEPSSWTKKDQPVMAAAGDVYGPGHCSFTSSKDDQESIVVYHAARWSGGGWNRSVRFGYTDFDENGAIQAMTPVSGEDTLKIPGGEKEVLYLDLKDTQTEGDLKLIADNEDDPGKDAVGFVSREDVVTFTISSHAEQDANITAYVRCEDLYEGVVTSMELQSLSKENSLPSPSSRNVFGAENAQPLTWRVHLTKGDNTFRLHSDMGGTKLTLTNIAVQPVN